MNSVQEKAQEENHAAGLCGSADISSKLWIYTNYDCNLRCSYCVAESSPKAKRHALSLETVRRVVDEAVELGFDHLFFTGGEPLILDDIYDMLAYSLARVETTVLTNAMLLRPRRLDRLAAVANENLTVQVSLDGGRPEHHDAYRGPGTWAKTVEGIRKLQARGLRVRLSTTETPANTDHLGDLRAFCRSLGIAEADHFIRPLARRGFAQEGMEVGVETLMPEVTVTAEGVYWHPLSSPSSTDMLVRREILPLSLAVECVRQKLDEIRQAGGQGPETFT